MRHFGFIRKLVLVLLLVGVATGLQDVLSSGPRSELPADISMEDPSIGLEANGGTVAEGVLRVVLSCFCPAPAYAGDCEGDVQGCGDKTN